MAAEAVHDYHLMAKINGQDLIPKAVKFPNSCQNTYLSKVKIDFAEYLIKVFHLTDLYYHWVFLLLAILEKEN